MSPEERLKALAAVAPKATQGPWYQGGLEHFIHAVNATTIIRLESNAKYNAAYLVHVSPDAILEIVEYVDGLKAKIDALMESNAVIGDMSAELKAFRNLRDATQKLEDAAQLRERSRAVYADRERVSTQEARHAIDKAVVELQTAADALEGEAKSLKESIR